MEIKKIIFALMLPIFYSFTSLASIDIHQSGRNSASIFIKTNELVNSTKIRLKVYSTIYYQYGKRNSTDLVANDELNCTIADHSALFKIKNVSEPRGAIFNYDSETGFHIDLQAIIEPGDNIFITELKGKWRFSGNNAAKYRCSYELWRFFKRNFGENLVGPKDTTKVKFYYTKVDSIALKALAILERFRPFLTKMNYTLFKEDIIEKYEGAKISYLIGYYKYTDKYPNQIINNSKKYIQYLKGYSNPLWNSTSQKELFHNTYLINKRGFLDGFVYNRYVYEKCLLENSLFSLTSCYNFYRNSFSGSQREWALYKLLSDQVLRVRYANRREIIFCINDAINSGYVKNVVFRDSLISLIPALSVGNTAFNFCLPDSTGRMVNLADFKGKVVLIDFWFFLCGNCQVVHPILDSIASLYSKDKFVVISVCFMPTERYKSLWSHSNMKKDGFDKNMYTSNRNVNLWALNLKEKPAEIIKWFNVTGAPTYFMIDKNGQLMDKIEDPRGDKGKDLINKINMAIDVH